MIVFSYESSLGTKHDIEILFHFNVFWHGLMLWMEMLEIFLRIICFYRETSWCSTSSECAASSGQSQWPQKVSTSFTNSQHAFLNPWFTGLWIALTFTGGGLLDIRWLELSFFCYFSSCPKICVPGAGSCQFLCP